jgi:formate C-acetyltransferase
MTFADTYSLFLLIIKNLMEVNIMRPEWRDFTGGVWEKEINVRDFIQKNYAPYDGDDSFLAGPTQSTKNLWAQVMDLSRQEREAGGVLDMDTKIISTITSHGPGYLNKDKEEIVGFQTEKPFKRSLQPYGGIRMAEKACADNGYTIDPEIREFFMIHRKNRRQPPVRLCTLTSSGTEKSFRSRSVHFRS